MEHRLRTGSQNNTGLEMCVYRSDLIAAVNVKVVQLENKTDGEVLQTVIKTSVLNMKGAWNLVLASSFWLKLRKLSGEEQKTEEMNCAAVVMFCPERDSTASAYGVDS